MRADIIHPDPSVLFASCAAIRLPCARWRGFAVACRLRCCARRRAPVSLAQCHRGLDEGARNTLSSHGLRCAGIVIGCVTITGLGIVHAGRRRYGQNMLPLGIAADRDGGHRARHGMPTTPAYIVMGRFVGACI